MHLPMIVIHMKQKAWGSIHWPVKSNRYAVLTIIGNQIQNCEYDIPYCIFEVVLELAYYLRT